ncbi:MAG: peptidoglycan-associated lipoprotein Pal [Rhodocyclaceae bacterium]|nr:peptidoglycan-associated lipoprotein Pal [Rhodocyclaceae bacterium]
MRTLSLILASSVTLLLAACGSQPPAPEQDPAGVSDANRVNATGIDTSGVDGADITLLRDPKSALSKREIFFDLDSYVVKDEYRSLLAAHAKFLNDRPKRKMLIQGNADERGSREYNLALGQKRSEAIKKALGLMGVREDQLEAVSLGEEKPRCMDASEECWGQNRRGDMLYPGLTD